MKRRILITSTAIALLSAQTSVLAFAQNNQGNITVIREAIPTQSQVIIANSPQDIALQEEIRRIRAYNAQVNSQIGISDTYSYGASIPAPVTASTYATIIPATAPTVNTAVNKYEGAKIELFAAPSTNITYASTPAQQIPTTLATRRTVATYTQIHRVIKGDTLYNLAKRNCVSVVDIKNSNALNGANISIGQVLAMPASQCGVASALTSVSIPAATPAQTRSEFGVVRQVMPIQTGIKVRSGNAYAVLPKDSLYSIGRRYCVKADALAGFNGIDTATPIQPGQILRIPAGACN